MDEPETTKGGHTSNAAIEALKRLVWLGALLGLVAGAVGAWLVIRYGQNLIPVDRKQVLIQENSAVVGVVKSVSPSVVSITSVTDTQDIFGLGGGQQQGAGTGMIVTSSGLILTNNHVVPAGSGGVTVFTSDGKEYKDAQVVTRDTTNDIAFVKIKAHGLKAIAIGDSKGLVVGQPVVAIGNALGQFQNTATEGIISGLGRPIVAGDSSSVGGAESLQDLIQTDAAINPGNSGGPLVNLSGQVIGMNTAVAGNAQNIGFAIPMAEITSAISSVESQGKIVRPYLGVRYVPITKELAATDNLSVSQGAYLDPSTGQPVVVADSPAEKAGLKGSDIITKVAGTSIDQNNSLTALIGQHKVGDKVTLTILRGGKTISVDVTLAAAPSS